MNTYKIILFLFCLIIVFLPLFACQTDGGGQTSGETPPADRGENILPDGESNADTRTPISFEDRLAVSDNLPEADFGGENFNILYLTWAVYTDYFWAEEEIGEPMNDALYFRQRDVGHRFNAVINPIPTDYGTVQNTLGRSVRAGSHDYDMALTHYSNELPALISRNMLLDWHRIPHLDFDKPWWSSKNAENEGLALNGRMFLTVSDFMIPDPNVTFFNKELHQNLGLEDPYQLVRDGKWTYGKMHELAKQAARDLDGDGVMTEADQFGLVTQLSWYFLSTANSAGIRLATPDETGRLVYSTDVDGIHRAIIAVDELINDKSTTFTYLYGAAGDQYISVIPLSTGRVLFHWDPLFMALHYRGIEFNYGILPWPKLTETQERHYHFSHNGFMVLPQTTPDYERTGIIVEALSAMSYKHVLPAYYENLMGIKLTRDLDSVEMLNLIYETCIFDPGRNYLDGSQFMHQGFFDLLSVGNTDYVSYHERNIDRTQAWFDKFHEEILNLPD